MDPRNTPRFNARPVCGTLLCVTALLLPSVGNGQTVETTSNPDTSNNAPIVVQTTGDTVRYVRPLRTYRGVPVRINTGNDDLSIGVVRPLRDYASDVYPGVYSGGSVGLDARNRGSWTNRFDRSDRWTAREIARGRIILDAYPDYYYDRDESIGVVRAYRYLTPPVNRTPFTVTNENAEPLPDTSADAGAVPGNEGDVETVGPTFDDAPESSDGTIYAVRNVELDVAQRNDPWVLLNNGYYREARDVFTQQPDDANNAATQDTGRALAAALSGDLSTAKDLMPERPALPEGFAFTPSTARRVRQTAEYVLSDHPTLREALRSLVTAEPAPSAN